MRSQSGDAPREEIQARVDDAIEEDGVVLFMKGDPRRPQCGFSQRAVGVLNRYLDEFRTVNVLESLPAYRAALETHSGWETIPQVFVDGEFIGGSDILAELDQRGELADRLGVEERAGDADTQTGDRPDPPF